jgi:hypothetical protein
MSRLVIDTGKVSKGAVDASSKISPPSLISIE